MCVYIYIYIIILMNSLTRSRRFSWFINVSHHYSQALVANACNPSYFEGWAQKNWGLRIESNNSQDPISKITRAKWTGGTRVIECLLCKWEVLSSNPNHTHTHTHTHTHHYFLQIVTVMSLFNNYRSFLTWFQLLVKRHIFVYFWLQWECFCDSLYYDASYSFSFLYVKE
jgi:hypothetical protein